MTATEPRIFNRVDCTNYESFTANIVKLPENFDPDSAKYSVNSHLEKMQVALHQFIGRQEAQLFSGEKVYVDDGEATNTDLISSISKSYMNQPVKNDLPDGLRRLLISLDNLIHAEAKLGEKKEIFPEQFTSDLNKVKAATVSLLKHLISSLTKAGLREAFIKQYIHGVNGDYNYHLQTNGKKGLKHKDKVAGLLELDR